MSVITYKNPGPGLYGEEGAEITLDIFKNYRAMESRINGPWETTHFMTIQYDPLAFTLPGETDYSEMFRKMKDLFFGQGYVEQIPGPRPNGWNFFAKHPTSPLHGTFAECDFTQEDVPYYLANFTGNMVHIRNSEDMESFTRRYQRGKMIQTSDFVRQEGMCCAIGNITISYEILFPETHLDDIKWYIHEINWDQVQKDGYMGIAIHPSVHDIAMKYAWYNKIGTPMAFVWNLAAFTNPDEDFRMA